jgi:hypothetical protein
MSPLFVIPSRHPFARSALPDVIAHMDVPDFRSPPPPSSLFTLVRGCALSCAPTIGSPWLPRNRNVRLDATSDPGPSLSTRTNALRAIACWVREPIGLCHDAFFGTRRLQGQPHLLPLHLAFFRAYASSAPLPGHLQGSMPGPSLTVTRVGFPPTRLRDLARSQPRTTRSCTLHGKGYGAYHAGTTFGRDRTR